MRHRPDDCMKRKAWDVPINYAPDNQPCLASPSVNVIAKRHATADMSSLRLPLRPGVRGLTS